jgi:hypothetical protein
MRKLIIFLLVSLILFSLTSASNLPFGAEVTSGNSSRANITAPMSIPAQAGNVTEINIFGYSITKSWQGYFGNVSGTMTLSDSANNVMYNWSIVSPRGQVYASTNNSIQWENIQCFNYLSLP